ncbi:MAG: hypothetical protein IIT53_15110 [Fibrobacter sp.]|nr:hypothetical protein [Fibrobacter sp.]
MKKLFVFGATLSFMLVACGDTSSTAPVSGGDESSSATTISSGVNGVESSGSNLNSSGSQPASSEAQVSSSSSENPGSSAGAPSSSSTAPTSSSVFSGSAAVPVHNISLECLPNHDFDGNSAQCEAEPYPYMSSIARLDGLAKLTIINANLNLPCGLNEDSVDSVITEAKKAMARTGANLINDTLFVNIERNKGVDYKCGCNARVEFLFDGQYVGFGYTAFDNNGPTEVLDAAKDRPRQVVEDVSAQCRNSGSGDDPLTEGALSDGPTGDDAIPPVAYMYNLGNKAEIVIENVQLTCGTQFENIDVSVGGDTLYVKPTFDESSMLAECICPTKLDFYIKADEAFMNATLLVLDYAWDSNPSNKMRIIKETHVTPAN